MTPAEIYRSLARAFRVANRQQRLAGLPEDRAVAVVVSALELLLADTNGLERTISGLATVEPDSGDVLTYDYDEVARHLGVSRKTVERLVSDGELPVIEIGRRRQIAHNALCEWISDHSVRRGSMRDRVVLKATSTNWPKQAVSGKVKALGDNGQFEAILSTATIDRDGESVALGAFNPLPPSIPLFYSHDWKENALPVGRATPTYEGGRVIVRGRFGSSARAQELRGLVNDGLVDSMSAGFIVKERSGPTITKAELFEASFTPLPVNTEAKVLASKARSVVRAKATQADIDAYAQAFLTILRVSYLDLLI